MYLSQKPTFPILPDSPPPTHNVAILVISKIINAVMLSAQEVVNVVGFINRKQSMPIRLALEDIGHPQGVTPLQFDKKCATGIINDGIH